MTYASLVLLRVFMCEVALLLLFVAPVWPSSPSVSSASFSSVSSPPPLSVSLCFSPNHKTPLSVCVVRQESFLNSLLFAIVNVVFRRCAPHFSASAMHHVSILLVYDTTLVVSLPPSMFSTVVSLLMPRPLILLCVSVSFSLSLSHCVHRFSSSRFSSQL